MLSRRTIQLFVLTFSAALFAPSFAFKTNVPTNVAYVSEEGGRISVIDLASFQLLRATQPKDVLPRGISLAGDGEYVVTANKGTSDISIFEAGSLRLLKRIYVGGNPEFVKMHPSGKWLFVSCEPVSEPALPEQTESEEERVTSRIAIINVRDWSLERSFAAGTETEGIEFSQDGRFLIVANEGQNTLSVFNIATGQRVREVDLASYGSRPRGVKLSPKGNGYAVTMEGSAMLLLLDQNFKVTRSAATGAMPDGVAFDRQGRQVVVAAARAQKVQFFSADSLQFLGEAAVGQRCWHFTFTKDDSQVWVACGRSNSVEVIDATTYHPIQSLTGFLMPWGIVTYPRTYGSLDLP